MGKRHYVATLLVALTLLGTPGLNGGERLAMRISPTITFAPGSLRVSVVVETDEDNRSLQIVAESPDFYRSSQIPLDGANAPRLNVFELRQLPTGLYQVTSVLVGVNGQRGAAQRMVKVQPSAGTR